MTDAPEATLTESSPPLPAVVAGLLTRFPEAEHGASADGIPFVRVAAGEVPAALRMLRDGFGYGRFLDVTAVDDPRRADRFELQYLLYSMSERLWVRLKARTGETIDSACSVFPGANWCERELYDLFGVHFAGHPDLTRIMLPDDWQGHPLRRDVPVGEEPVDFTVTREIYGT